MTREEMLNKLHSINFQYIDPPSEWKDIGFTERPIWVNAKGYGYLSCDDPTDNFYECSGVEQEKWNNIRTKLKDGILQYEDVEGTSISELLDVISFGEYCEDENPCNYLMELLTLSENQIEKIYCIQEFEGWIYFDSEEEFKKAYERDEFDYAWDDLSDEMLNCWVNRLFEY